MNDLLQDKLKKLHFSGIIKTADMRIEQAIREKLSYQEFLELLINDELMNRTNNGNKKRMQQQAKFPQLKTLEEFNFNYQPSINRQIIYHLGRASLYVRKRT